MRFFRYLRARLFLLPGEYTESCPRCLGQGSMAETVDRTPLLADVIALLPGLTVRRDRRREVCRCWLCQGRGWRLHRSGYVLE